MSIASNYRKSESDSQSDLALKVASFFVSDYVVTFCQNISRPVNGKMTSAQRKAMGRNAFTIKYQLSIRDAITGYCMVSKRASNSANAA